MPDTPLDAGHIEWISCRYRDLEDNELFWFKSERNNNPAFRKINNNEALVLSSQSLLVVDPRTLVYQKDY